MENNVLPEKRNVSILFTKEHSLIFSVIHNGAINAVSTDCAVPELLLVPIKVGVHFHDVDEKQCPKKKRRNLQSC